jgi:hypothetical protein
MVDRLTTLGDEKAKTEKAIAAFVMPSARGLLPTQPARSNVRGDTEAAARRLLLTSAV